MSPAPLTAAAALAQSFHLQRARSDGSKAAEEVAASRLRGRRGRLQRGGAAGQAAEQHLQRLISLFSAPSVAGSWWAVALKRAAVGPFHVAAGRGGRGAASVRPRPASQVYVAENVGGRRASAALQHSSTAASLSCFKG